MRTCTTATELDEEVLTNRGGPERPLIDDELATKFRDNAARGLDHDDVERPQRTCRDLAGQSEVRTSCSR